MIVGESTMSRQLASRGPLAMDRQVGDRHIATLRDLRGHVGNQGIKVGGARRNDCESLVEVIVAHKKRLKSVRFSALRKMSSDNRGR